MSNLNFKEVQDLESRFENLTGGGEDLSDVERAVRLGKYEKLIVDLHDRGSFDPALLEHLLQFGTVIRRTHEPDLLSVAIGVFELLARVFIKSRVWNFSKDKMDCIRRFAPQPCS